MTGTPRAAAVVGLILATSAAVPFHKFHVTQGRMAVEGTTAACEIRFFKHDLEAALAGHAQLPGIDLEAEVTSDSLFLDYLDSKFQVVLNGARVGAELSGSGEETIREEQMWWYMIQYEVEAPIASLEITNRLLFELFDDQRNILKVQHFPSEKRATFYFVSDADHHTVEFPV